MLLRPSSTSCPTTRISVKTNAGWVSLKPSVLPIKSLWLDLRRQLPSRASEGFFKPPALYTHPPYPEPIITLQGSQPSSPQTQCQRYKRKVRTGSTAALNATIVGTCWLVDNLSRSALVKNGLRCGFWREHDVPHNTLKLSSVKDLLLLWTCGFHLSLNITMLRPANGDHYNI